MVGYWRLVIGQETEFNATSTTDCVRHFGNLYGDSYCRNHVCRGSTCSPTPPDRTARRKDACRPSADNGLWLHSAASSHRSHSLGTLLHLGRLFPELRDGSLFFPKNVLNRWLRRCLATGKLAADRNDRSDFRSAPMWIVDGFSLRRR
jgi:hypothetical protein